MIVSHSLLGQGTASEERSQSTSPRKAQRLCTVSGILYTTPDMPGTNCTTISAACHATCHQQIIAADADECAAETTVLIASEHSATFGHSALQTDITDVRSVLKLSTFIKDQYGCLDYAVNCAAVEGTRAPLHTSCLDHFDVVCDVNLRGTFLCMREELQLMLQGAAAKRPKMLPTTVRNGLDIDELELKAASVEFQPAIVNVASTAGMGPCPEFSPYAATKAAIISLTQSAAIEYAGHVRINAVCPATTYTPMYRRFAEQWPDWQASTNANYAVGRIATAEEVARAIVWMLGRECSFMTGSTLRVDGGHGFAPPPAEWFPGATAPPRDRPSKQGGRRGDPMAPWAHFHRAVPRSSVASLRVGCLRVTTCAAAF